MNGRWIFRGVILLNVSILVWSGWHETLLSLLNFVVLGNLIFMIFMRYQMIGILNDLLSITENSTRTKSKLDAIKTHLLKTNDFVNEIRLAISNINEIGQKKFEELMISLKDDEARTSLLSANEKIIALRKKENESNWITMGVAQLSELKLIESNLDEYCLQAISAIVKYLNANQGGFFLLKNEYEDEWFELAASYAYGKRKFIEKRINPGEGLIGQLYYERDIIYMTDVPKDYVRITSGLGEALPRCICIVPLLFENNILGAIEIASFKQLESHEMDYLKKIAEGVGYTLHSIENHKRTERLLEESQRMAQEVKSQEEELRQNMEELTATQEQMRRKQSEIDAVMASLSTVELDLDGCVLQANLIFLGITGYALEDIQGRFYKSLIPQHGNDPVQYEIMWNSILSGRSFSGEFRIVNKSGKEMWMAGNFTPIINDSGQPYKVMVISLFTTQDKEKLFELQEMVTAFKNCFPMAELNHDMTFKSANDLFLSELGVRRIELKRTSPRNVLSNGSYSKVEKYLKNNYSDPGNLELDLHSANGDIKKFNSTLINVSNELRKKGILILRNELEVWKQVSP